MAKGFRFGLVVALLAILAAPSPAEAGRGRGGGPRLPYGVVRYDGNGYLIGCAVDPNVLNQSILVHLYVQVPATEPGAVFFGSPISDYLLFLTVKSADLGNANLNQHCDPTGTHGYRMIIPPQYRDDQPHTFFVWAIDNNGRASNRWLGQPGDPRAYAVNVTVGNLVVIGALDGIREEEAVGWVIDPDTEATPTSVQIYVNGPAGQGGTFVGQALADIPRPDLNDWGFEGDHRFVFPIPDTDFVDSVTNEVFNLKDATLREFWTHGIDPNGPNFLIDPDPKHYALGDGVEVIGPAEVVFDYDLDACLAYDVPDLATRAWVDSQGNVNLVSAHHTHFINIGPDFDSLAHDCTGPVLASSYEGTPESFNNAEWLASTYSPDGEVVYGLVHNEYHGRFAGVNPDGSLPPHDPNACPSEEMNGLWCWYNSITAVVRNGLGQPFVDPPPTVSRLVATLAYQYASSDDNPRGYRSPSNIHHNVYSLPAGSPPPSPSDQYQDGDGLFYVLFDALSHPEFQSVQGRGTCVMRTDDLSDPARWEAWDGLGFTGMFVNPYPTEPPDPENFVCEPILAGTKAGLEGGLTWNTHLEQFVAVDAVNRAGDGFFYATGNDLTQWSEPKLIMDVPVFNNIEMFDERYLYASLIDHDDDTRNFEKTGQTAYLYSTRFNQTQGPLNRDLVRFLIRFRDVTPYGS